VRQWVASYKKHPEAPSFISGGEPEQTICAVYQDVPIKVRFDYINVDKGYIADVKTTKEPAGPEVFAATAFNENTKYPLMYDLSAALYLAIAEQYYGKPLDFYFIVLSKADVACDVYRLSAASRAAGQAKVNKALLKYKQALATGVWTELAVAARPTTVVDI